MVYIVKPPYRIPEFLKPLLEKRAKVGGYTLNWIDSNHIKDIPRIYFYPRHDYDTPKEYLERKKQIEGIDEEIDRAQFEHGEYYREQFEDSWEDIIRRVGENMQSDTYMTDKERFLANSNDENDAESQLNLARYYKNKEGRDWRDRRDNLEKYLFFEMKAAKNGNANAQFEVGREFLWSGIIQSNKRKAAFWLQKAAEQDHAEAQQILGRILGRSSSKDYYKMAVYWMEKAAKQGNAGAQTELAGFYMEGTIVKKDIDKAIYWYEKAAEGGYANSSQKLAQYYCRKNDKEKALYWYKKAVDQGDGLAAKEFAKFSGDHELSIAVVKGPLLIELAELYEKEKDTDETIIQCYKEAIEIGWDPAIYSLARYYEKTGNINESLKLYEEAADLGNADAMYAIAQYYKNKGHEEEKMIYWYRKAMEKGHKQAGYELGQYYEKQALNCYDKAHVDKSAEAAIKMAKYNEVGMGYINTHENILSLYLDAGFWGNAEGQYKAAQCFERGYDNDDGKPNRERAFAWYMSAAENGHIEAQFRVAKCYETGYGTEVNKDKAVYWNERAIVNRKKKTPVSELGLTFKTILRLHSAGIETVGDLLSFSRKELVEEKHFTRKIMQEIVEELEAMGFALRGDKPKKNG